MSSWGLCIFCCHSPTGWCMPLLPLDSWCNNFSPFAAWPGLVWLGGDTFTRVRVTCTYMWLCCFVPMTVSTWYVVHVWWLALFGGCPTRSRALHASFSGRSASSITLCPGWRGMKLVCNMPSWFTVLVRSAKKLLTPIYLQWVITDARHDSTANAYHTTVPCMTGSYVTRLNTFAD